MSVCLEANSSTVLSQATSQVQQVVSGPSSAAGPPPADTLAPLSVPAPPPVIGTQVTTSIKCTSATSGSKVIVTNAQALTTSVTVTSGSTGAGIVHHKQPVITVVNNPLALKGLPNAVAVAAPTYTLNPSVVKSTNSVTLANVPAASLVGLTTSTGTIITANLDKEAGLNNNNNNNNTEKTGPIHNVFVKKSSLADGTTAVAASTGGASTNVVGATPQPPLDQHFQQQIPLSHKILTANTFPSNNVITSLNSTPVLKTTVNGQRPLNSNTTTTVSTKVKIISNVVMASATTPSHSQQQLHHINTNSTQLTVPPQQQIPQQLVQQPSAGPSHGKQQQPQQLRYYQPATGPQHQQQQPPAKLVQQLTVQQPQHQQVIIGNGATKYLNNKGAAQGIIHSTSLGGPNATILNSSASSLHPLSQQHTLNTPQQHQIVPSNQQGNQQLHPQQQIALAERKMVYQSTTTAAKNKTCQAAYKGPGAVQRTGAGLRTIPPQKPSGVGVGPIKTNYIGKHAVQAQRIKHTKAKVTKASLHPSYINTTVSQASLHHQSQQQLHIARPLSTQLTFNQALTAQILETLGTDAPYKSMNHNHYDQPQQQQQQQQQQHLSNSSSLSSLSHQPLNCGQSSMMGGMVSPPFASPPHYGGRQVYQQQERQHYQQRRNDQHQQQLLQHIMSSDEDQFTNLDKLSLVCQTVLLDHNYHIKSPQSDNHPQSPPNAALPNVMITPNALIPPQLMSPTIPGLPQLPLPSTLTGLTTLGQQQQHQLNGLLTARERRNSRTEMLQQRDQHATHLQQLQQHKQQPHQSQQPSHLPHSRNNSVSSITHLNDDDAASDISDAAGLPFRPGIGDTEGEETDTAPEAEAETDQQQQGCQGGKDGSSEGHGYGDYVTRCICGFIHDDGYMIECDRCKVWQHVRCVIRNRKVPDDYMCEECEPGKVCDRQRARALQQQWMREIQERDAKDREARMRKENLLHQNNHGQPVQHSDTDSSDNDGVGGVRMVNVGVVGNSGAAGKRRKDGTTNRRQPRGGSSGARAKRKERKIPIKRSAKNNKSQAQNEALSTALAVVSAQLNEADKLPQLRQWIENYEEAVTNHYSPELRARVSSIRVNGAHSDLGKVEPNVRKCKVQNVPPGVKCLLSTCALQANTAVVELRGKYMLSTQHKNSNPVLNNHAVVLRNYRPPGPFLFFHKLRDTTEVCVDTRTYGNSARFIRRSCTPNCHLRHVIEKGTLHLYIVTQRAVTRGDELTIGHDESHEQLTPSQLLEVPCACAQPATCALAQRVTVKKEAGEKPAGVVVEGRKRRGRYSRDSVGAVVAPPVEEVPVTIKTEVEDEELDIKQEFKETVKEEDSKVDIQETPEISPQSPVKKEKKEPTQHFAKSASDFLLENQQRNNNKIHELIESSSDVPDGPVAAQSKIKVEDIKTEEKCIEPVETAKIAVKIKEEVVPEASITTRSTTKKEISQCVKLEDQEEDDDDDSPPPPVSTRRSSTKHLSEDKDPAKDSSTSTLSTDDPKKLNREDRKLLAIMKAIERMERQEQRKQEHQAKQAAHRRESDPGAGPTSTNSLTVREHVSVSNSNSNSNDGVTPITTKTIITGSNALVSSADDAKEEGTTTRATTLKRRKRKGRARTVSTNTRRNRLDSLDSVHSSDDTLQSPPISGTTSPVKHAASLLLSLSSNNSNTNSQFSTICKSPERPIQPTTPALPTQPLQPFTPIAQSIQHQMDNCNSSSNSAHSSPEATPPPPMSSACLLVAAAMEPLESAAAAAAAAAGNSTIGGAFKFPKTKKGLMNEWLLTKNDTIQPASSISPSSLHPHISPNISNSAMTPTSPIPTYNNKNPLVQVAQSFCVIGNNGGNGGNGNGGSAKKRWLRQAISEDQCDSPPLVEAAVPPPKKRRIPQVEIVSPQRHEDDISCTMESETTLQELATEMRQEYGSCTISTISPPISMDTSPDVSNTSITNQCSGSNNNSIMLASELIAAALNATPPNNQDAIQQVTPPPPRVLLDPRLAPRLNSEQLVGTVEKTLSFLGFDQGDTSPISTQSSGAKRTPEIVTPAKRKLSITEYRQRKKLNVNDRGTNDEVLNTEENSSSHSPQEGPLRNRSNSSSSATSGVSTDLDELPTSSVDPKGALTAFNSEPTELEKQRELGSLRLKKAFGLSLIDEPRISTALDVEKLLKGDLPEPIKSSVSLASPTFPIPGSADLPTLAAVHQPTLQKPKVLQSTLLDMQQQQTNVNNININNVPSTTTFNHPVESPPSPNTEETVSKIVATPHNIAPSSTSSDSSTEDGDNHEATTPEDISATLDVQAKIEERLLHVIPLVLPAVNSNRVIALPTVSTVSLTDNLLSEIKQQQSIDVVASVSTKSELFYTPDDLEEQENVSSSVEEKAKEEDTSEDIEDSVLSDNCTVVTSYVPPFNNPLYPSTDYTSYGSIIDDEGPYAGRNPSPPPNMDDS